jgi:hypothetical protein
VVDKPHDVLPVLQKLKSQGKIVFLNNKFQLPQNGYRSLLLNLILGNGHIAEVQILVGGIEAAAKSTHTDYERARTIVTQATKRTPHSYPTYLTEELYEVFSINTRMKKILDQAFVESFCH